MLPWRLPVAEQSHEKCRTCLYLLLCFGGCRFMKYRKNLSMDIDCKKEFLDNTICSFVCQDAAGGEERGKLRGTKRRVRKLKVKLRPPTPPPFAAEAAPTGIGEPVRQPSAPTPHRKAPQIYKLGMKK